MSTEEPISCGPTVRRVVPEERCHGSLFRNSEDGDGGVGSHIYGKFVTLKKITRVLNES